MDEGPLQAVDKWTADKPGPESQLWLSPDFTTHCKPAA